MKKVSLCWLLVLCAAYNGLTQNSFPTTGNVGIGTLSPQQLLHVNGRTLISNGGALVFSSTANPSEISLGTSVDGNYLEIAGGGLLPATELSEDLGTNVWRFRNAWLGSNIYINTSMFINATDNNGLMLGNELINTAGLVKYPNKAAGFWRIPDEPLEFGTVNTGELPGNPTVFNTQLFISGNGNIGIGTTSPSVKLSVNGTMILKRLKISLGASDWADYVFEPDYRLTAIADVAKYIQTNKHLHGIPSAAEVEAGNLNIGNTLSALLKKVEELTLYIIQENTDFEKLKQEADKECSLLMSEIRNLKQALTTRKISINQP